MSGPEADGRHASADGGGPRDPQDVQDVRALWGGAFRAAWHAATAAGRRRTAQLAVGLPRFELVATSGARLPLAAPPSPDAWAAGGADNGTFGPRPGAGLAPRRAGP